MWRLRLALGLRCSVRGLNRVSRARSAEAPSSDRACKLIFFVVVLCLGAVALVMRRNGASNASLADVTLPLPRARLEPSEAGNLPELRSLVGGGEADPLDGAGHAARPSDPPAVVARDPLPVPEIATRGDAAQLEDVAPAARFSVDGAVTAPHVDEPQNARDGAAAPAKSKASRFNLDGEAVAEAPKATARFGVNGEAAVEEAAAAPTQQPRFGVNGEAVDAQDQPSLADAQPRPDRKQAPAARSKVPVAGAELPTRKGDSFGLDSEEPAVVAPARTKQAGILAAANAMPATALSPDDDPERPHLLGEIHEKLHENLHGNARFEDEADAAEARPGLDSDAARLFSDAGGSESAPEVTRAAGVAVDPAVVWKPKESGAGRTNKPAADDGAGLPQADEDKPRSGLRAHEIDTDTQPFLDAADLLDGHPRRSEYNEAAQAAAYKGKTIVK